MPGGMRPLALLALACLTGCAAVLVVEPEGTTVLTPFGAITETPAAGDDGLTPVDDLPPGTEDGFVQDSPAR